MVYEYLDGGELFDFLKIEGKTFKSFDFDFVLNFAKQLLTGVSYIH